METPCAMSSTATRTTDAVFAEHVAAADEYVLMRFAELLRSNLVGAVIDRALARHSGNEGCEALRQEATAIREAFAGHASTHRGLDHNNV